MRCLLIALTTAALTGMLWAEGIPVKSELVQDKCGGCHTTDSQQRMSRISYQRKTPEGWQETVRRMVQLHKVSLTPVEARAIVQYLGDQQGLTASEVDKISYALEQREDQEQIPNDAVRTACATCHSYARIAAQRRTKEEWLKLKSFLLAIIPTLVYQHRYMDWMTTADEALAYLTQQFPLETPEWQREKGQTPPGDSAWVVRGYQAGKGDYVGQIKMTVAADGSRQTQGTLQFADGTRTIRTATGHWFGAASWRGGALWQDGAKSKEIYHLSADGTTLRGRWLSVERPGIAGDETLCREDGKSRLVAVFPGAVSSGAKNVELRIYGADLPANVKPADLNLGDGVQVEKIRTSTAEWITLEASVSGNAKIGRREVKVGNASAPGLLGVYDKVDYIRVLPERTMGRLGGIRYSKQYVQFEARAYNRGPDGVPGNADDLDVGAVKPTWAIQELYNAYDDKDREHVGSIDQNGLFTPAVEGPNPERYRTAENSGDVWVTAEYKPGNDAQALKARAYLLVSLPKMRDTLIP
jgi:quinohemoprotein amine dehydrogenase